MKSHEIPEEEEEEEEDDTIHPMKFRNPSSTPAEHSVNVSMTSQQSAIVPQLKWLRCNQPTTTTTPKYKTMRKTTTEI